MVIYFAGILLTMAHDFMFRALSNHLTAIRPRRRTAAAGSRPEPGLQRGLRCPGIFIDLPFAGLSLLKVPSLGKSSFS